MRESHASHTSGKRKIPTTVRSVSDWKEIFLPELAKRDAMGRLRQDARKLASTLAVESVERFRLARK